MANFHNIFEFASGVFGIDRNTTNRTDGIDRNIYRASDQIAVTKSCSQKLFRQSNSGLGIAPICMLETHTPDVVWGVKILGMIEGSDIEASRDLPFPFSESQFWDACDDLDTQLEDARAEWNAQADDRFEWGPLP